MSDPEPPNDPEDEPDAAEEPGEPERGQSGALTADKAAALVDPEYG